MEKLSFDGSTIDNRESYSRRAFSKLLLGGMAMSLTTLDALNSETYQSIYQLNEKFLKDEAPDGVYWQGIRKKFMFQGGLVMMNNGTVGPMPKPVFNTLVKSFKVQATNPFDVYNYFPGRVDAVRTDLARMINASPGEVVITRNTTEGMNFVANGLDLKEGDEVLISSLEHPAGIHPWRLKEKRFGIKVTEVALGAPPKDVNEIIDAFEKAISSRTRVISISHTVFITGLIFPLKEICDMAHKKGILVLADSAHGLGMIELDMKKYGVDFFTSSPYKWLGAPTGRGLLYVRKDVQDRLWPTIATSGWDSHEDARKYETFSQRADALTFALGEALNFQNAIGKSRIERRIKAMSGLLRQELEKIPGVRLHTNHDLYLSAGLTAFSVKGVEPVKLVNYLRERWNIVIRTIGRKRDRTEGVRVSTHIFVTFNDVQKVIDGVHYLAKRSS